MENGASSPVGSSREASDVELPRPTFPLFQIGRPEDPLGRCPADPKDFWQISKQNPVWWYELTAAGHSVTISHSCLCGESVSTTAIAELRGQLQWAVDSEPKSSGPPCFPASGRTGGPEAQYGGASLLRNPLEPALEATLHSLNRTGFAGCLELCRAGSTRRVDRRPQTLSRRLRIATRLVRELFQGVVGGQPARTMRPDTSHSEQPDDLVKRRFTAARPNALCAASCIRLS